METFVTPNQSINSSNKAYWYLESELCVGEPKARHRIHVKGTSIDDLISLKNLDLLTTSLFA